MCNTFKIKCNICFNDFDNTESKIMLNCDHNMCIRCLKTIFLDTKKCPFCRKKMQICSKTYQLPNLI